MPKKIIERRRGLDALLSHDEVDSLLEQGNESAQASSVISEVEIKKIKANPSQPRMDFDKQALDELAESIKQIGLIQPIVLRKMENDEYQIVAGERRLKAAKQAGLKTIPAYVRTIDDDNMAEMALVENIQREDLNAIEIALAFQDLMERYGFTQEKLSARVGKKRATVANYLRLLKLPAAIQMGLKNKQIEMGHARALLALDDPKEQMRVYQDTVKNGYSVRKLEEVIARLKQGKESVSAKNSPGLPKEYAVLKKQLSQFFDCKVSFYRSDEGKGKISIPFDNDEDLVRIMSLFDEIRKK